MPNLKNWLEIQATLQENENLSIKSIKALIERQYFYFQNFSEKEISAFSKLKLN